MIAPKSPEVADIFREYGSAYQSAHKLPPLHLQVMDVIVKCRTEELGGHLDDGYNIARIDNDCVEMIKWKRPPLSFLLYLLMGPVGWVPLILNWFLGYKYVIKIVDKNGQIKIITE
jgi:hypothetical protein